MTPDETLVDRGFLAPAIPSPAADQLFAADRADFGYVMNLSHAWAHEPAAHDGLMDLLTQTAATAGFSFRQRGVLVSATAGALGDPHCSLAWGKRLAGEVGDDIAAAVLRGDDAPLEATDRMLAHWARTRTHDPNAAEAADVQALRDAGFDDAQIAALTLYVALRIAFSTVNDALGARPDRGLVEEAVTDVDDSRLVWGTPKTHGRRSVPLPRFLVDELARTVVTSPADELAFPSPQGAVLRNRNARSAWFEAAARAIGETGLTPHELRHTAASLAIKAGANVKAVQRMLGHVSAAMTLDRYADLLDDDVADRLDTLRSASRGPVAD